jgi:acetyl-CoA carboxylase biotin carboxylase subunit
VDTFAETGTEILPFYDSLIAKLIVWAPTRLEAIERMDRALSEFQIEGRGVKTTIPFHRRVFANEQFRSGDVTTDFVEHFLAAPVAV